MRRRCLSSRRNKSASGTTWDIEKLEEDRGAADREKVTLPSKTRKPEIFSVKLAETATVDRGAVLQLAYEISILEADCRRV